MVIFWPDLTPIYVPHAIIELSKFCVLFGGGAGPAGVI